jgi:ubiquinone/menaquinone biosynthesis C-methylase UbiE
LQSDTDRIERERAFHDDRFSDETREAAAKYYSVTRASNRRYRQLLDRLEPGQHALEIGCGLDETAVALARRGVHVTAVDVSSVAIGQFVDRAAELGLEHLMTGAVMDAEDLDLPDASVHCVFGTGILHHLDLERAFGELRRVLHPRGFGVFVEPLGHNPLVNLYRRLTPKMRTADEHPLLETDFELARRKFRVVTVSYFHAMTLAAVPLRRWKRFPSALDRLERTDQFLFDRVPATSSLAWMCVLELGSPRPSIDPAEG